jgi:ribosomal-protein-alanine N-acetyltransferase
MNVRPATLADIPSMMNLERECATAGHWTEQQYTQLFRVGEGGARRLALVAEAATNGESGRQAMPPARQGILGFLIAHHIARDWELENIVVAPTARQQGIGTRLLNALLAAAHETNGRLVFLEVRESNSDARRLYEKAGFEQSGRRKSYYKDPLEDAILYRRTRP